MLCRSCRKGQKLSGCDHDAIPYRRLDSHPGVVGRCALHANKAFPIGVQCPFNRLADSGFRCTQQATEFELKWPGLGVAAIDCDLNGYAFGYQLPVGCPEGEFDDGHLIDEHVCPVGCDSEAVGFCAGDLECILQCGHVPTRRAHFNSIPAGSHARRYSSS